MYRTLLAAAAAVGLAGSAFAGTTFVAKLESPVAKQTKVVVLNAVWDCNGDTCVAELSRNKVTVRTCKKVVKEVGKVAAFSNSNGELTEEEVATCNAAAK